MIRPAEPGDLVQILDGEGRVVGFLALDGGLGTFFYVEPTAEGSGAGAALWDEAKRARPEGFTLWAFQRTRERDASTSGATASQSFTDGSGNEERTLDVRYEWRP